jgi:hypothetical protein
VQLHTDSPSRRGRRNVVLPLTALLVLTAALAGATAPADAAFPGDNGPIAYATTDGSIVTENGTIFEAPEGTVSRDVAWSRDGTRLVFSSTLHARSNAFEDYELYVVNADGSGLTRLTFNNLYEYEPTWHPSGTEIAFVRNRLEPGIDPAILRMPVIPHAGAATIVSRGSETGTPAWSPDGSSLAYTGSSGSGDSFRIDVYTTTAGRLTTCCDNKSPSWSPDGGELAFEREGNIWRMRADGTSAELVIAEPFPTRLPAWSPDGHDIAARWFGHGAIGVYDAGGGFRDRVFGAGFGRIDWQPLQANTQPGTNVAVTPVDPATGAAPVTLTFASVASAGKTALTILGAGAPPPTAFRLGDPARYYDLTTTATFAGTIRVCIDYAGLTFPGVPRLFHEEAGVWIDRTTSVDQVAQRVCGETTSLSPFALFSPASDTVAPVTAAAVSPEPNASGWHSTDVTVTLDAGDEGGSGVREIRYAIGGVETVVPGDQAIVPLSAEGVIDIAYHAVDEAGNAEAANTLTVRIDKTAPAVSCEASPSSLWPPNHRLVKVIATVASSDALSGGAGLELTSATSSEPDDGSADGSTTGDVRGWTAGALDTRGWLRAERAAVGAGRTYTLRYAAADVAGNTAWCDALVRIPLNRGGD